MNTEQTLMKIAAKAWMGATSACARPHPLHRNAVLMAFREIQALADAELAAIQKRREAA